MTSNGHMPTILGATRERSKSNEAEVEALDERLDRVEAYAKIHAGTLSVLAAQALGIPTQKLLNLLLSIL